jgi:hypothetical protein
VPPLLAALAQSKRWTQAMARVVVVLQLTFGMVVRGEARPTAPTERHAALLPTVPDVLTPEQRAALRAIADQNCLWRGGALVCDTLTMFGLPATRDALWALAEAR